MEEATPQTTDTGKTVGASELGGESEECLLQESSRQETEMDAKQSKTEGRSEATEIINYEPQPTQLRPTESDLKLSANEQLAVLRAGDDSPSKVPNPGAPPDEGLSMDVPPMPPRHRQANPVAACLGPGAHAVANPINNLSRVSSGDSTLARDAPQGEVTPESGQSSQGLTEAQLVMDYSEEKQQARPISQRNLPAREIIFLAAVGVIVVVGIIVAGVCGSGHCSKKEVAPPRADSIDSTTAGSINSTKASRRDEIEAANIGREIQNALGRDYFGSGSNSDIKARQQALHWILHEDPLQVNSSNPEHVLQRYTLVLLYIKTTATEVWTECNPFPDYTPGFCYYPEDHPNGISSQIWGSRWLSGNSECQWAGILCNEERNIKELMIWTNNLNGPLPWELSKLSQLTLLDLFGNALTGTLPTELGNLVETRIDVLSLASNKLEGTIPSELFESNRTQYMQWIILGQNLLTGTIPTALGMSKWAQLSFTHNLLSGSLPTELLNLSSMEMFLLEGNRDITGTLPAQIDQLSKLKNLFLGGTSMSGTIPSEMALMSGLVNLDLAHSSLGGTIPEVLYPGMPSMKGLGIAGCHFSGTISSAIGYWSNLNQLDLGGNQFSGTIPTEIGMLTNLYIVSLNGNNFTTKSVPHELCAHKVVGPIEWYLTADCLKDSETGLATMDCPDSCCTTCCDPKTNKCEAMLTG